MEQLLKSHLRIVINGFMAASGYSEATICKRVFGSDRFLNRIEQSNASFTIRTYDNAMQRFSDNWPADAEWPSDVPRPQPSDKQGDASC